MTLRRIGPWILWGVASVLVLTAVTAAHADDGPPPPRFTGVEQRSQMDPNTRPLPVPQGGWGSDSRTVQAPLLAGALRPDPQESRTQFPSGGTLPLATAGAVTALLAAIGTWRESRKVATELGLSPLGPDDASLSAPPTLTAPVAAPTAAGDARPTPSSWDDVPEPTAGPGFDPEAPNQNDERDGPQVPQTAAATDGGAGSKGTALGPLTDDLFVSATPPATGLLAQCDEQPPGMSVLGQTTALDAAGTISMPYIPVGGDSEGSAANPLTLGPTGAVGCPDEQVPSRGTDGGTAPGQDTPDVTGDAGGPQETGDDPAPSYPMSGDLGTGEQGGAASPSQDDAAGSGDLAASGSPPEEPAGYPEDQSPMLTTLEGLGKKVANFTDKVFGFSQVGAAYYAWRNGKGNGWDFAKALGTTGLKVLGAAALFGAGVVCAPIVAGGGLLALGAAATTSAVVAGSVGVLGAAAAGGLWSALDAAATGKSGEDVAADTLGGAFFGAGIGGIASRLASLGQREVAGDGSAPSADGALQGEAESSPTGTREETASAQEPRDTATVTHTAANVGDATEQSNVEGSATSGNLGAPHGDAANQDSGIAGNNEAGNGGIASEAIADQTGDGRYHEDTYEAVTLPKGTLVAGGAPGQSNFYTDLDTIEASGRNAPKLFQSLQVQPHPKWGYRPGMTVYEVQCDTEAASGTAEANPQYGSGGGRQLWVRTSDESALSPKFSIRLDNGSQEEVDGASTTAVAMTPPSQDNSLQDSTSVSEPDLASDPVSNPAPPPAPDPAPPTTPDPVPGPAPDPAPDAELAPASDPSLDASPNPAQAAAAVPGSTTASNPALATTPDPASEDLPPDPAADD